MENQENKSLKAIFSDLMLQTVPSYANKIYYSLGFLSMTSFMLLLLSGMVMVFFGPDWWLTNPVGVFFRSIHLWAVQAFILFILLHLLIVFSTAAYRPPRQLTWVIGIAMLALVLVTAEFGYLLRGDLSSQIKAMHGAEFYGQIGVWLVNNLNYAQVYGLHIVVIPILILGLLGLHYLLVKVRGIAKPFDPNVSTITVPAKHKLLFIRGLVLALVIILLAILFPSPYMKPLTIKDIAKDSPPLVAKTILSELDHSSDTAGEAAKNYHFDTASVFVYTPYQQYASQDQELLAENFAAEPDSVQQGYIKDAGTYFASNGRLDLTSSNPAIAITSGLVSMAQSGLYEDSLRGQLQNGFNTTYAYRFLIDTGAVDDAANNAGIGEDQHGILKEENVRFLPPGSWWLAPMDLLQSNLLKGDPTVHRTEAEIFAIVLLLAIAFPFIPWVNRLPEKLPFARWIWREKIKTPS